MSGGSLESCSGHARANPCCLTEGAPGRWYCPGTQQHHVAKILVRAQPRRRGAHPAGHQHRGGARRRRKEPAGRQLGRVPGPARPQRRRGRRRSGGRGLHTLLGIDPKRRPTSEADEDQKSEPIPTRSPGWCLMPPVYDPGGALLRSGKKARWLGKVRELPADYVLLDLGAGISHTTLDLFVASDVGVCVTVPEPPAIESTYRFLRALFVRQLRRSLAKERYKLRLVERAMKDLAAAADPARGHRGARTLRFDAIAALAVTQLGRLHARLVVSQTRVRSDLELGPAMRALAGRYLGIDLDYIGYVEHDDAVWLTVRRNEAAPHRQPDIERRPQRGAHRPAGARPGHRGREGRVSEARTRRLPPKT